MLAVLSSTGANVFSEVNKNPARCEILSAALLYIKKTSAGIPIEQRLGGQLPASVKFLQLFRDYHGPMAEGGGRDLLTNNKHG